MSEKYSTKVSPVLDETAPFATFPVTCVVGTVVVGSGDDPPAVAAMRIIVQADIPGMFEWNDGTYGYLVDVRRTDT